MRYEVQIVASAEREMAKLPTPVRTRISRRILSLEDNPRPRGQRNLVAVKNTVSESVTTESYILSMTRVTSSQFSP